MKPVLIGDLVRDLQRTGRKRICPHKPSKRPSVITGVKETDPPRRLRCAAVTENEAGIHTATFHFTDNNKSCAHWRDNGHPTMICINGCK
jgi:hypothetical protein